MNTLNDKFFQSLFGDNQINFRCFRGKKKVDVNEPYSQDVVSKLQSLNERNYNIYFVVNSGGYSNVDINQINSVFIDFDCGRDRDDEYHPTDVVQQFKSDKLQVINDFELKPSAIIETRNGLHVYWFVQNTATVEQFKDCIARLVSYFQSDPEVFRPCNLLRATGFYWCKDVDNKYLCQVIQLNDVRYKIDDILHVLPEVEDNKVKGGFGVLTRNNSNTKVSCKDAITPTNDLLIKNRDIAALQALIEPIPVTFNNHKDVFSYLRIQDLGKFLGITTKYFCCIFHDDKSPSANIYEDPDTGYFWYKCFSGRCGIVRDIISITEKWLGCSTPEALRFLRQVYNITYQETAWQKEQKEILEENKRLLYDQERLSQLAPKTYKRIKSYIPALIILNDFASLHVLTENFKDNRGNALFYVSLKELAKATNQKDPRRLRDRISFFAYLGLVNKLSDDQIPEFMLNEANHYAAVNGHKYRRAFYSIPSYCERILAISETKSSMWVEYHYTIRGFSREMILRKEGHKEADRIYPQMIGKQISDNSHRMAMEMDKLICLLVWEKGWTTKTEILQQINLGKRVGKYNKDVLLKRYLPEILDKYGLKLVQTNKEIKKHFGIAGKGYPFIIVKNDVVTKCP